MEESKKIIVGSPLFLPVLPLKNLVALPKSIVPVGVGRDISIKAVEYAMRGNREVFVTAQKSIDTENPSLEDVFHVGTRAQILQVARMSNGTLKVLVEGITRSQMLEAVPAEGFLAVMAQDILPAAVKNESELAALWRNLYDLFKEYVQLNEKATADVLSLFRGPEDLDHLTDTIAVQMHLDFHQRQHLLEMYDVQERALHMCVLLKKEIEILKAEKNIRKRVQSQVEKHQKDYYLTEQMRAIQRELGREDHQLEINELRKKAKKAKLSPEAMEKVESEFKRLEQMQPTSPEASVSRNYVEWIINLPWHKETKDKVSISAAEKILNSTHFGMKKPKERIIEFLAAKKFAQENLKRSPIICLAGPPGVGKTSLAHSIAQSLGRELVRISLGGMRDEAEIRGHRRTYIGAMPGKIIQAMKKAKVTNPVIVLDEIDKMSMDFRGDPASALLEVLDPEQNKAFADYFLEIDYDLSKIMFVTTANVVDNIPYPLLDRMEIIYLSGYTEKEKLSISKSFLLPKLTKEYGLKDGQVDFPEDSLKQLIEDYTKEAGVRSLERVLAKLIRKSIQMLLKDKQLKKVVITPEKIDEWLGVPPFKKEDKKREDSVGVATGLAWTEVGGDILEIEITILRGKGGLTLTGQLGEVMQESAQAAMSYIRSRAQDFGLKEGFYADVDIHIHVPEGAIPKDGPSAGITMAVALTSALTGIPVRRDVAMTGEVTLRGRVLAIGGLKEKLLAAWRFGITKALVPQSNKRDVKEFKDELDKSLTVVFVETMDEVLQEALVRSPFVQAESMKKSKNVFEEIKEVPPKKKAEKKASKKATKKEPKKKKLK
ncbi:endopeptidase La [Candidatus Dependentiae bacterium]|nr:endopeptidase La [Candidatus Dependentiae bacterium]